MKILDEIIEKCQENVDLVDRGEWEGDCFLSHEYMVDALYYLKEYRKLLSAKSPTTQKKSVDQIEEDLHGRI